MSKILYKGLYYFKHLCTIKLNLTNFNISIADDKVLKKSKSYLIRVRARNFITFSLTETKKA